MKLSRTSLKSRRFVDLFLGKKNHDTKRRLIVDSRRDKVQFVESLNESVLTPEDFAWIEERKHSSETTRNYISFFFLDFVIWRDFSDELDYVERFNLSYWMQNFFCLDLRSLRMFNVTGNTSEIYLSHFIASSDFRNERQTLFPYECDVSISSGSLNIVKAKWVRHWRRLNRFLLKIITISIHDFRGQLYIKLTRCPVVSTWKQRPNET